MNSRIEENNLVNLDLSWSKMYGKKIEKGEPYSKANKTIAILVAKCKIKELMELKEYHSKWKIIEDEHRELVLTDKFEIHIIELEKINKVVNRGKEEHKNKLDIWCKFLLEPRKVGDEDMDDNEAIKRAIEVLEEISQSEEEREKAELREKYVKDQLEMEEQGYNKGKEEGRKEGKKEGRKEGKEQERIDIARKMKTKGISVEDIIDVTGLSKEIIENL